MPLTSGLKDVCPVALPVFCSFHLTCALLSILTTWEFDRESLGGPQPPAGHEPRPAGSEVACSSLTWACPLSSPVAVGCEPLPPPTPQVIPSLASHELRVLLFCWWKPWGLHRGTPALGPHLRHEFYFGGKSRSGFTSLSSRICFPASRLQFLMP